MAKKMSIEELRKELANRENELAKLTKQREKLAAELADVDAKIQKIGGKSELAAPAPAKAGKAAKKPGRKPGRKPAKAGRPGKRVRRGEGALVDYIRQVLQENPAGMRAKDIAQAVKDAGYPTKSKDFYTIVAAALRDEKEFARVSRGIYKLK